MNTLLIIDTSNIAVSIDTSIWILKQENKPIASEYSFSIKNNKIDFMSVQDHWPKNFIMPSKDSLFN